MADRMMTTHYCLKLNGKSIALGFCTYDESSSIKVKDIGK
jgi:hypothetical protein